MKVNIPRIVLLAATSVLFGCAGTIDSAGGRIDVSVDKATEKLQGVIEAAASRGSEMIEQAALRGAEVVKDSVTHARQEAQTLVKEAVTQVGQEARRTLDKASGDLRDMLRETLTRAGDLMKILLSQVEDIGKAWVAQLIRGCERVVKDGLDRVETKTLPQAKEQTIDLLTEIGKWWDKILYGIAGLAGTIYTLKQRSNAKAERAKSEVLTETFRRARNGSGEEGTVGQKLGEHFESVVRDICPTKLEGKVREMFRGTGDGTRPKTGTGARKS